MYSIRNVLKQEPANVVAVLMLLVNMLIAMQVVSLTDVQIAATNAFLYAALNLFYVRPLTESKDALRQLGEAPARPLDPVTRPDIGV